MKSSPATWLSSASPIEEYIVPNIMEHFPDFKIQCTPFVIIDYIFYHFNARFYLLQQTK